MYRLVPMTRFRWVFTFVVVWPPSQRGKEFSQPSSESTHLSLTLQPPPPCLYFHAHSSQCHIVMRFSVWAENGGENEISGLCSFRFSSPHLPLKTLQLPADQTVISSLSIMIFRSALLRWTILRWLCYASVAGRGLLPVLGCV